MFIETEIAIFNRKNKGKVRAKLKKKSKNYLLISFIDSKEKQEIDGVYLHIKDISTVCYTKPDEEPPLNTYASISLGCADNFTYTTSIDEAAIAIFKNHIKCERLKDYTEIR